MIGPISGRHENVNHRRFYYVKTIVSYETVGSGVAVVDLLTITFGSMLTQISYAAMSTFISYNLFQALCVGLTFSVFYIPIVRAFGAYGIPALVNPLRVVRKLAISCVVSILAITGILFLSKISSVMSRGALLGYGCFMLVTCIGERFGAAIVVRRLIANQLILGKPVFLIGDAEEIDSLSPTKLLRQFGASEVGRFYLKRAGKANPSLRAQICEALRVARSNRPKEFMLALSNFSPIELREIEEAMRQSPLPVRLLPTSSFRSVIDRQDYVLSGTMHCLELQRAPLSRSEQMSKRALDICGATLAILVLLPVLIAAAFAVSFDSPGPIIFRQKRNGFDEVPFAIFKFRTMSVLEDGSSVVQARRGDSRITRVGAFLRSTSIDELPQLLNVLRGEMSLVGPRPHALVHDKAYRTVIDDYLRRHHVKPGMTGWAQVNGFRGETAHLSEMQRRVDFDLWYINHWSLALEFFILFRTLFSLTGSRVY